MTSQEIWVPIAVFLGALIFLVFIRNIFQKRMDAKTPDVVAALVVTALFLLVSGRISNFSFGGVRIEKVFEEAVQQPLEMQIQPISTVSEEVISNPKEGIRSINRFIQQKTQALTFRLNTRGYYYAPAIREYLGRLSQFDFFKYVVIYEGKMFYGMFVARDFIATFRHRYEQFVELLENKQAVKRIPGFIGRDMTLRPDTDKRTALEMMEELRVEELPVVNEEGVMVGIVSKSRLVSTLLVEVANGLSE